MNSRNAASSSSYSSLCVAKSWVTLGVHTLQEPIKSFCAVFLLLVQGFLWVSPE